MPSFVAPEQGSTPHAAPSGSASPEAPPYSPITPPLAATQFPPLDSHVPPPAPSFMEKPPDPEPLDLATSSDAIALRAAISSLQVQRMRALKDMQTLEQQKAKAISDPERFAKGVARGEIRSREEESALVAAMKEHLPESNDDSDNGEEGKGAGKANADSNEDGDVEMADAETETDPTVWKEGEPFGDLTTPQDVVRMPPINWAKYHVVGEPLEALHNEQRARPDPGLPKKESGQRAEPHKIAAPYSPWKDKLGESSMRTRKGDKKG